MRGFMVFLFTIALGMLIIPPLAMAHGGLARDIAALDDVIEAQPADVHALLHRADLLRLEGQFQRALEDLERVDALQPANPETAWVRARILIDQGREAPALGELDEWLDANPDHVMALGLRAQVHAFVGDLEGAAEDYTRAMAASTSLDPEWVTALAEVRASQGQHEEALAVLERGMRTLGPLLSLQLPALDLELALGRADAALTRLDAVIARVPRKETWLARRAELLERLGRDDEARRDWAAAVSACESLPAAQRNSPAVQSLMQRARHRINDAVSLQS